MIKIETVHGRAYFFCYLVCLSFVRFTFDPVLELWFTSEASKTLIILDEDKELSRLTRHNIFDRPRQLGRETAFPPA